MAAGPALAEEAAADSPAPAPVVRAPAFGCCREGAVSMSADLQEQRKSAVSRPLPDTGWQTGLVDQAGLYLTILCVPRQGKVRRMRPSPFHKGSATPKGSSSEVCPAALDAAAKQARCHRLSLTEHFTGRGRHSSTRSSSSRSRRAGQGCTSAASRSQEDVCGDHRQRRSIAGGVGV